MKNTSTYARRFASLYRRIRTKHAAEPDGPASSIIQLVISFLEWNASRKAAETACQRLMSRMVDINDLRVSHPHEVVALLGPRYLQVEERTQRLLEALQEIFQREQTVTLDMLATRSKKEVRAYLDSLPGVPPYVAAQVTLVCFEGHAVPVDDRLAELLRAGEIVDPQATVEQIESFLERQIRAEKAPEAHAALRAWVDAGTRRVPADSRAAKKAGSSRSVSRTTKQSPGKKKVTRSER